MDPDRFDRIAKSLAAPGSRRRVLGGLLGGALGLLGRGRAAADHGCRHPGAACTRGTQCCSRDCRSGTCRCTRTSQCPRPGPDRPCTVAACDKATGRCGFKNKPRGAPCDDGVACTTGDTCDGQGACRPGTPDDDLCTGEQVCASGQGCGCPGGEPDQCGSADDPICVALQTDVEHCGTCATDCTNPAPPNATPACAAGRCAIGACDSGFADCNGQFADGCETNTRRDPRNCGACGNVCPGLGQPGADVFCIDSACTFTCQGNTYDVDNNPANGCERSDDGKNNHTQATAFGLGAKPCQDGASSTSFSGRIVSDSRIHNPTPTGFSFTTGSAPDWFVVRADGGDFCTNDLAATIRTSGGSASGSCYRLTVRSNKQNPLIANVSGSGSASIPGCAGGCYTDGSDVYFTIEKTCNTAVREDVGYTVDFHL